MRCVIPRLTAFLVVMASISVTSAARATPICVDVGDQSEVRLVPDGAGGVLLTWIDDRHGYDPGLRVQHLLSTGAVDPAWTPNGRTLSAPRTQETPFIVADGAHGAIVGWTDYLTSCVYAQHVRADGTLDPAWPANGVTIFCNSGINAVLRDLVSDDSGGAIAIWDDNRVDASRVYAQHIRGDGTLDPAWPAAGRQVSPGLGAEAQPRAVSDGAHGAVIVWTNYSADVYAHHLLANGTLDPVWPTNGTALFSGPALFPVLVSDGAGGAIVAWHGAGISAQHVNANGTIATGWPAAGFPVCTVSGQFHAITTDGAGGAIIAWQDHRASTADIYALRLLSGGGIAPGWATDGNPVCTRGNDQLYPDLTSDGAGGAIITWQDASNNVDYDIYALRVRADGTPDPAWPPMGLGVCICTNAQYNPQVATDGAGGVFVAWQDLRNGTDWDIYCEHVHADGTVPVLLSLVSAEVGASGVELTWFMGGSGVADVYRSLDGAPWMRVGRISPDGMGYLRYVDRIDSRATRAGYRLGIVESGLESFYGETWVDLPAHAFALEPVRPNPSTGGPVRVRFSLANGAVARLELLDIAGRRMADREVGSLGAGTHVLELSPDRRLAPGLFTVRLTQGANVRLTRVAVLR